MSNSKKKSAKNIHESSTVENGNGASQRKKGRSSFNEIEIINKDSNTLTVPSSSENDVEKFAFEFFNISQSPEQRLRKRLVQTEVNRSHSSIDDKESSKEASPCKKKRSKSKHDKTDIHAEIVILEGNSKELVNKSSVHSASNSSNNVYEISSDDDEDVRETPFTNTTNTEDSLYSEQCTSGEDDIEFNFLKHNTHEIIQETEHEFRIILYREAIIYIHGLISLRVLQGSVEILGCKLTASNETVDVYSPGGSSLLSISNCTKSSRSDTAIVLCFKLDTKLCRSLSLYGPKNIFPPLQDNGTNCIVNAADFFENFSLFVPSPEWDAFANTLTSKSNVVIAGNKGTGKSTLLRYLVNQLLSKDQATESSRVLVVDLDPGQPEFTPPGCISIVMVKSPLLGPNYTHQQKPEKCIHISSIDIKNNMDEYIRCCKYLLTSLKEYPNIPTLVNYMGYSRGLGQELISTIISFVNPTNIVQLNDPGGRYNFKKNLSVDNIKEDAKWIPDSSEETDLRFELVQFETVHNYNKLNSVIYTSGQLRDIAVVSYFSPILKGDPLCLTDPEVRIYSAPLDKIKIRDSMGNSHPAICNANLVSLCQKVSFENKEVFKCLGWGVVRCVSISRNIIYLITPLKFDLMENVEYLLVCSARLPLVMYITTAKDILGQIPYIEGGQQTDLEKPSKRQHYSREKSNQ